MDDPSGFNKSMFSFKCICVHTCAFIYRHIHVCVHAWVCVHACAFICMHRCMCVHVNMCMSVCVCV